MNDVPQERSSKKREAFSGNDACPRQSATGLWAGARAPEVRGQAEFEKTRSVFEQRWAEGPELEHRQVQ